MTLDKTRKYSFLGDEYKMGTDGYWRAEIALSPIWTEREFQHFADRGAVTEVREPRTATMRLTFNSEGFCYDYGGATDAIRLAAGGKVDAYGEVASTTWDAVFTEVLP